MPRRSTDPSGPPERVHSPPANLSTRSLPLRGFAGTTLYRGHPAHLGPIHFNRVAGRFAPPAEEFGTVYLGESDYGAFLEAFGQEVAPSDVGPIVSEARLQASCLCPVLPNAPLRLVDVTNGAALNQIMPGLDNRIGDGPHTVSQAWALAFWNHPSQPDGVYYRSRRAPELHSLAIFGRPELSFTTDCGANLLRDPERLGAILDYFRFALIP